MPTYLDLPNGRKQFNTLQEANEYQASQYAPPSYNLDLSNVPSPETNDFYGGNVPLSEEFPQEPYVNPLDSLTSIAPPAFQNYQAPQMQGVTPPSPQATPPPSDGGPIGDMATPMTPAFQNYQAPNTTTQPKEDIKEEPTDKKTYYTPTGGVKEEVSTTTPTTTDPFVTSGITTQTSSNTSQTIYGKQDKANYEKAINNYRQAQDAIGGIMKKINNDPEIVKQVARIASTSLELQDMLDPNSENFKSFTNKVNEAKTNIEKAEQDLAEFQKEAKVDPNRYAHNMSNTGKAIKMIAKMLEGFGAAMALRGGVQIPTGMVSKQLQQSIDQDIALQKDELASKEKGLTTDVNRYSKNLALLKDERAAELKTKSDMLTVTKMSLDNLKAQYQGQMDEAEFQKVQSGLDLEIAKTNLEMNKRLVNTSVNTTVTKERRQGQGIDAGEIKKRADAEEAMKGLSERDVPLFNKYKLEAYSKEEAKDLRDQMASYEGVMSMLETMKKLEAEYGNEMLPTDAKALGDSLAADFLLLKKNLEKLGVLSEADKDIITDLLKTPKKDWLKTARVTIENQLAQSTNKMASTLNSKTKVGENRVSETFLYDNVKPIAQKRADEVFKRVFKPSSQKPSTPVPSNPQLQGLPAPLNRPGYNR